MDLVIHEVHQFEEMGVAHGHRLVEGLTGTAVDQLELAGVIRVVDPFLAGLLSRRLQEGLHGLLRLLSAIHLIEGHNLHAAVEVGSSPTHQQLEHLADIHAARNPQRVQHDVNRCAIGEIWHVFPGKDAADDSLVAVATGHLVAHLDLAALGHIHAHHHVGAGRKLIALFSGVDAHIHHTSTLSARDPE
ncbi:MAG: Uncharacterised protein [Cyanobium sp. ARS6]|nr:MAG: Uncharacterised protein [Cyanobium sp. ARS6]